ncbi:MAG: hypothetical protein FWE98_01415 [Oscillospiraceae bacterium]|nr:hypothetical protein [Oscillospiraceae bacterium]
MADKDLTSQEKQRLKEKEKFERERKKWKQQESRKRVQKTGGSKNSLPALLRIVAVAVAAAVVIGLGSIYAGSYGLPRRFWPALTVGKQTIDVPEWTFTFYALYRDLFQRAEYYGQYGINYGLDTHTSLFEQQVTDDDGSKVDGDVSLRRETNKYLQRQYLLYSEAQKASYQLPAKELEALDEAIAALKAEARGSAMSANAYLRNSYTAGLTQRKYRQLQERDSVVQGFSQKKLKEFLANHPDEELLGIYEEDRGAYDQVDYRVYSVAKVKLELGPEENMEALEARQAADDAQAKREANDLLRGGTQESFIAAVQAYDQALYDEAHQHEEDEEVDHEHNYTYDAESATLNLRRRREYVENTYRDKDFTAWVFGAARKAGDATVLETDSAFYAVYVVRPPYAQATVDFYAIEVPVGEHEHEEGEEHSDDEASPQELAQQKADELLAQWEADGGTLEAFAALAAAQPDPIEREEGAQPGLIDNIAPGDFTDFDSWLFGPERKAGDTTVIEAGGSYIILYLASRNEDRFAWQKEIGNTLAQEDFEAYVLETREQYPLGYHGIGMRYAKKETQRLCDTWMIHAANYGGYNYY